MVHTGQEQTNIINKKAQNIELILLTFVSDYSETIVTVTCSRNSSCWFILWSLPVNAVQWELVKI